MNSITIAISYSPADLSEMLAILDRVDRMKSAIVTVSPLAPVSPLENDAGPLESEYKRRTGTKRFRLTTEEKESGKTKEEIARDRLDRLENGESVADPESDPLLAIPAPSADEKLPDDDDLF